MGFYPLNPVSQRWAHTQDCTGVPDSQLAFLAESTTKDYVRVNSKPPKDAGTLCYTHTCGREGGVAPGRKTGKQT